MSKYINLIDKLTDEDKIKIETYIDKYGCRIDNFIGINPWLQNWSHANQKLYKLLGNSLIKEFPFEYEKTREMLIKEMNNLLEYTDNNFIRGYEDFYHRYLSSKSEELGLNYEQLSFFRKLISSMNFVNNEITESIKFKKPDARKMLQIQAGAKPFRAINQVINYFKDDWHFDLDALEEIRKKHAIIFSEKIIKGTICISIHPLDFMTMSDNASNWTSCMSWKTNGCYHVGTVEMMNSNNVLCCYLKDNKTHFIFDKDKINPETGEIIGVWNNKRWRSLYYITKDIIMSGKPYPYSSLDLTNTLLLHIHDLAKENLNWNYQFGPERYKDMVHIDSMWKMDNQREWLHTGSFKKHNIIWDTNGMYNDMLNDANTTYMCFRNKVEHTKIISVSGKANCLCCNSKVINWLDEADEYNDRYENVGSTVCNSCIDEYFSCDFCSSSGTYLKIINTKHGKICSCCLKDKIKICPDCGNIFFVENGEITNVYYNPYIYEDLVKGSILFGDMQSYISNGCTKLDFWDENDLSKRNKILKEKFRVNRNGNYPYLETVYSCPKCAKKIKDSLNISNSFKFYQKRYWSERLDYYYIVDPKLIEKNRYWNLRTPSLEEFEAAKIEL